ncbi:unnamed protein product [Rhizopus microsporus]
MVFSTTIHYFTVYQTSILSAILFALGSLMIKSTVEGAHIRDAVSADSSDVGTLDSEATICLGVCNPRIFYCPEDWKPTLNGNCWTCCHEDD